MTIQCINQENCGNCTCHVTKAEKVPFNCKEVFKLGSL